MTASLLGKCPGCKKELRLPEEWATQTVRCKYCGLVSQANFTLAAKAKRAAVARPPLAPTVALPKPAQIISARPVAARPVAANGNPFADLDGPATAAPSKAPAGPGRYRQKQRSWLPLLLAFFVLALCVGGAIVGIAFLVPKLKEQAQETSKSNVAIADTGKTDSTQQVAPMPAKEEFPRRLLGISVNNYLYANPISYGTDPSGRLIRDFGSALTRFADKLKISKNQLYQLSDGAPGNEARSPLKSIIEQTVTRFVETSRAQDRVTLIFAGHSIEIDGKPYLVPLEGDLDDAKTLIPLEWLLKQLADCKAQQKVLIADLNRYDAARGVERPNGGKLAASTEQMLKNPPPGVQVVSACSKDQYSYEFDDYAVSQGFEIKGGAFLAFFMKAFEKGIGGISRPGDPIPIDAIAGHVIGSTKEMFTRVTMNAKMESVTEIEQEPFLAGAIKGEPLAYNAEEAAAEAFEIPAPDKVFDKGLASTKVLEAIMNEIAVPPVKPARSTGKAVRFESVVPFSADVMKNYGADASVKEIMSEPEKYPLRIATLNAIEVLRKVEKNRIELPDEIRSQQSDAQKAMLKNLQKGPAQIMAELQDVLEALEKAGETRKEEKSKRWQAHYDYILAQVKAKLAYMHEYSLMTGQVRRDALPELDKNKGQTGWRLASNEKLQSNNDIKEQMKEARKLMAKIVKDYPGTPWEVLAKRERFTAIGLEWVPTSFGSENVTAGK